MNTLLWVLQGLLALHTLVGALWKLSNSEQAVPSLRAIPHRVWRGLSVFELCCSLGVIVPAFHQPLAMLAPVAAACIAAEMLVFCGLHVKSRDPHSGPMLYWLVVAVLGAFIAYGRS
jgi:hypothetical protein